jgi:hypothetical protein
MYQQMFRHWLAQTDAHIERAIERLEGHSRTIEQHKLAGHNTMAAEELMARFERAIEGLRSRRTILNLLAA